MYGAALRTRGVANFIRWSSPLRGRHRAMAANPELGLRGDRAHTQATVLGQLKKTQQNRATAPGSRQITAKRFMGPRNLPDARSVHGVFGFIPARFHQPEFAYLE
jgi:hypothetical protein